MSWKELPEMLDADLTVFAVGLAGDVAPWGDQATLSEIARYFAAALLDAQVAGPFHIMGHSFGGMLAYEVACQLREAGVDVGLVLVADTGPEQLRASTPWTVLRNLRRLLAGAPRRIQHFALDTTTPRKIDEIRRKLLVWKHLIGSRLKGAGSVLQLDGALDTRRLPAEMKRRMETNLNAFQFYNPAKYAGRLVLFRAAIRPLFNGFKLDLAWDRYVGGGVEVVEVPGNHMSMLEPPNAKIFAAKLQEVLNRG
jgi:thioesterase domain-containing protein